MNMQIRAESGSHVQRTERGVKYDQVLRAVKAISSSRDEGERAEWKAMNEEVMGLKAASGAILHNYVIDTMSVAYQNDAYIGERLMPTVNLNGRLAASYYSYSKRDQLAYPDDSMAERANANELSRTKSLVNVSLTPRALREYVDELTLNNPEQPLNELVEASANALEGMAFLKEKRIAAVVGASANYGSNTTAIAAASRWDVGGDPVADIIAMTPGIWSGRGPTKLVAFTSLAVWNVLRQHPRILDLFKFNGNSPGLAAPSMLANWFGVDELLIGSAWQDTANEGQTASYSRIWPDVFGIVRVAQNPGSRSASWGVTFQDRANVEVDTTYSSERGTDGGWYARAKVSDSSVIVAADTGWLLTTVIG
jgi:hypothetical protein